jgi:hypothetical protein
VPLEPGEESNLSFGDPPSHPPLLAQESKNDEHLPTGLIQNGTSGG